MNYSQLPLANEMVKSMSGKSRRCVVRIYFTGTDKDPKIKEIGEVVGTGLIMNIAGKICLITARHILEDFQKQKPREMGFSTQRDKNKPLKLFKNQINLRHTNKRDDVAIAELNDLQIREIQKDGELVPLGLEEVWTNYDIDPNRHVGITGFPSNLTKINKDKNEIGARELRYVGLLSNKTPTGRTSYKKDRHFLIDYKELESMDISGNPIAPPEPMGVSGGAVWSLFNHKNPKGIWTPGDIKIIGICRTWLFKDEVIYATRMDVVLEIAGKMWPEIESVLKR